MRSRRQLTLALIAALLAAVVVLVVVLTRSGPGPTPPPRLEPREAAFGADFGVIFQSPYPPRVIDRALATARQAGLGLARVAPLWEATEPLAPQAGRHLYDWRYDDRIARHLARGGFRWVAVLAFAPGWASAAPGVLHAAPRGTANYAAYAAAVARRYRGLTAAFEIWNEENTPIFWRPAPNPVAYARLYAAARLAIHRADPGVPVLIGGLAGGHTEFLTTLLRQPELRGAIDGVAVHAYAATPEAVLAQVERYRRTLDQLGFATVPLYVTEYGWSSRRILPSPQQPVVPPGSYAPAAQRPGFIVQTARDLLSSGCDVRMAIFYAWLTQERNPASLYDWYGVSTPTGAATPATQAIAREATVLRQAHSLRATACPAPR
jgi:hypothetical protein